MLCSKYHSVDKHGQHPHESHKKVECAGATIGHRLTTLPFGEVRPGQAFRVQKAPDLLLCQDTLADDDVFYRFFACSCFLNNLGSLIIPDQRVERCCQCHGMLNIMPALLLVRPD